MTPGEAQVAADGRRALYPRLVVAAVIHGGAMWAQWGHWRHIATLGAVFALYVTGTVALARFLEERRAVVWSRFLLNLVLVLLAGHFSAWSFPAMLYLTFFALARGTGDFHLMRLSFLGILAATVILAIAEHADPAALATCSLISLATYASTERRLRSSIRMLDDLAERNRQLAAAQADLEAMHARAVEQEKLSGLGLLAAGIAHEINNPMAYVTANVEMFLEELRRRSDLDATMTEYATDILPATMDGIRRVNSIVRDLRRFARGDREGMVSCDLNEQASTALRIMNGKIRYRCELETAIERLPRMTGLPQQLVQVLIILLDNAVGAQAEMDRGWIRLAIDRVGDDAVVRVSDRGVGMTTDVRARLFQPFFTTKPVGQGTGLGLSIAYGIVKAHGGDISVETTPGQGSTFTVRLPLNPQEASKESAAARLAPAG